MQTSEVYRKLRFTLRYLLGNLHDFDPAHHTVPHAMLPLTDRYMLHRLAELVQGTEAHYQSYQFSRAFQVSLLSSSALQLACRRTGAGGRCSHWGSPSLQLRRVSLVQGCLTADQHRLSMLTQHIWPPLA